MAGEQLFDAACDGDVARVQALLNHATPQEISTMLLFKGPYGSPLMVAAQCGHDACARVLLERAGSSEEVSRMLAAAHGSAGWTALHYAASHGHDFCACLLLEHAGSGEERSRTLAAKNAFQDTPLHFAARNHYAHLIRTLLSFARDAGEARGMAAARNKNGETPVDFAKKTGLKEQVFEEAIALLAPKAPAEDSLKAKAPKEGETDAPGKTAGAKAPPKEEKAAKAGEMDAPAKIAGAKAPPKEEKAPKVADMDAPGKSAGATTPPEEEKGPAPEKAQSAPEAKRNRNRWGLGLDAPAAGERAFFPHGWTPTRDAQEATSVFGHSEAAIDRIFDQGEHLARKLKFVGVSVAADHAGVIYAYTEEDKKTDLYGSLNLACRTATESAEKRLIVYRDYLYHLREASGALPNFEGVVFRGIDCWLDPESYAVGKTVTWQGFSSASKSQQVARSFLTVGPDRKLIGTMFIIQVKTGKEIEQLSAIPEEEEVLIRLNSHFKVLEKVEEEATKKASLPDLKAYKMCDLDVYKVKQI